MLAIHDTDQWVSMVGEILRTYPATGALNLELEDNNATFAEVLSDLRKLGKYNYKYLTFSHIRAWASSNKKSFRHHFLKI